MDMPMGEEGKNLEEIKIIDVVYTAPPYKSSTGGVPKAASKAPASKAPASKSRKSTKKSIKKSDDGVPDKKNVEIPLGIGPDEIKDPDVLRNLWS
jgi:hypothetical protein